MWSFSSQALLDQHVASSHPDQWAAEKFKKNMTETTQDELAMFLAWQKERSKDDSLSIQQFIACVATTAAPQQQPDDGGAGVWKTAAPQQHSRDADVSVWPAVSTTQRLHYDPDNTTDHGGCCGAHRPGYSVAKEKQNVVYNDSDEDWGDILPNAQPKGDTHLIRGGTASRTARDAHDTAMTLVIALSCASLAVRLAMPTCAGDTAATSEVHTSAGQAEGETGPAVQASAEQQTGQVEQAKPTLWVPKGYTVPQCRYVDKHCKGLDDIMWSKSLKWVRWNTAKSPRDRLLCPKCVTYWVPDNARLYGPDSEPDC